MSGFIRFWVGAAAASAAVALLSGWGLPALDPETDALARAAYNEVRTGSPTLEAHLSADLRNPEAQAKIAQLRSYIPAGEPRSGRAIGWNYTTIVGQGRTAVLNYEYDYPGKVALAQITMQRPEGARVWLVNGLHVQVATLEQLNALKFSLANKSPAHYAFLGGLIASLALMLASVVKVVRTRGLRRKWLWVILSFLGIFTFTMNWYTGQVSFNLLNVAVLGAGVVKGLSRFDPWMVTFILPLGAILILTGVWGRPKAPAAVAEEQSSAV